jgi:hypothetical protein
VTTIRSLVSGTRTARGALDILASPEISAPGTRLPFHAPQKLWQLLRGQADISVAPRSRGAASMPGRP